MNIKTFILLFIGCLLNGVAIAQKPFIEGNIIYKVRLKTAEGKEFKGSYIFTIKDGLIKKELKLADGYQDVVIINCVKNTAYSLKTKNGKKFAIQLSMDELKERQVKYQKSAMKPDINDHKNIAGITVFKGNVQYNNGSTSAIYYTSEWYPDRSVMFERYPDVSYLPLVFDFEDENGVSTYMEADKVNIVPIENIEFKIPSDYKIISHKEYKELCK